jgi:PKD repeat protein
MRFNLPAVVLLLITISTKAVGQNPLASFSIPDSICLDENISIINNSLNIDSGSWDFCSGDLFNIPSSSLSISVSGLSNSRNYTMIHSSSGWYGFSMSITDNNLFRLSFGNDPSSIPSIENLGNIGNKFNRPIPLVFTHYNQNWYAFVHNGGLSNIVRLDFGNDLNSNPIASDVISSVGGDFSNMDIGLDSGNFILLLSNYSTNNFSMINLGNSPTNIPQPADVISTTSIPGANFLDVKLINDSNNWFGFAAGYGNKKIYSLNFNNGLAHVPIITELTGYDFGTEVPTRLSIAQDLSKYMLLVSTESGHLFRAVLGNSLQNSALEVFDDLGNLTSGSNPFGLSLSKYGSQWIAYMLCSNSALFAVSFPDNCSASKSISNDFIPSGISYSVPGRYYITFTGYSAIGNSQMASDSIFVKNESSPPVSFSTNNACLSNTNQFSASSPSDTTITSWIWDFGDGSPTANGQATSHQYSIIGRYLVSLNTQTTSGCSNSISDSISIFNPPVASFNMPLYNRCTNTQLSFINTSSGLNDDSIHFTWNFNNEGISNDINGQFTFTNNSLKNIVLAAEITGCIDSASQQLNIVSGPYTSFSWTQNCWDSLNNQSTPLFLNAGDTSNVVYSWNFGDSSPASSLSNPAHTYTATGMFQVKLTAKDTTNGCITISSDTIIISDSPLATFQNDAYITENIPAYFLGKDLTGSRDSIITWQWRFDSLGTSGIIDPVFTFPDPGNYRVTLSYQSLQQCSSDTSRIISVLPAQCPSVSFVTQDSVCTSEVLVINNNSVNTNSIEWDFCAGDLFNSPTSALSSSVSGLSNPRNYTMIHSASGWYGFSISITDNNLFRLSFGNDPASIPSIENLGNIDNKFNRSIPIVFTYYNQNWYAFVHNGGLSNIVRLDFGADLNSIPTTSDVISSVGGDFSNMDIGLDNGNYILILSNYAANTFSMINLGNSPVNNPQASDILTTPSVAGANFLDVKLFKDCNHWYGFATGYGNKKIYSLDFNTGLANIPVITELAGYDFGTDSPTRLSVSQDLNNYLLFISTESGHLFRAAVGNNIQNAALEVFNDLGNLTAGSNPFGLSLTKYGSRWIAYMLGSNAALYAVSFPDNCGASISISNEYTPVSTSYSTPGKYYIACTGFSSNGNSQATFDSIFIKSVSSPAVSFSTSNACLAVPNNFNAASPGDSVITSWTWDFGDGSPNGSGQFTSHQFDTEGLYSVKLKTLTVNGCGNNTTQKVAVYSIPIPDFYVSSGLLCSNSPIIFNNSTISSAPDSMISYHWNLNGEAGFNIKQPTYVFTSGGLKNITLAASITGCSADTIKAININESPAANFVFQNECTGVPVKYQNTSTGAIDSISWIFGDGYTSSLPEPVHHYDSPGKYNLTLTVSNNNGCSNRKDSVTTAYNYPTSGFQNDLPCTNNEISFYDTSYVPDANITSWSWEITNNANPGILENSNLKNPVFNFTQAGDYSVKLLVQSNYGCADSLLRTIKYLPSPVADYSYTGTCNGDSTTFIDLSAATDTFSISRWTWNINGNISNSANTKYLFADPGNYSVNLSVTSDNLCVNDTGKTIIINPLPDPSFTTENQCNNQTTIFRDNSSVINDTITWFHYEVESAGDSFGPEFSYRFDSAGTYQVKYTVNTSNNCINSITDSVVIHQAPKAGFESLPGYGAVPLYVNFINRSTDADTYSWNFGDNEAQGSIEQNPVHTYESAGSFTVWLKTSSQSGCRDSTSLNVNVEEPYYDIAINKISKIEDNGKLRFILEINNPGTVIVENMDILIHIENNYSISESFQHTFYAGDSASHLLDFELLTEQSIQPQYLCFELIPHVDGYEEQNIANNTECLSNENEFRLIPPYPNPVSDNLMISFIMPDKSEVFLELMNANGKSVLERNLNEIKKGYNSYLMDIRTFSPGMYFLNLRGNGFNEIRKIIVTR